MKVSTARKLLVALRSHAIIEHNSLVKQQCAHLMSRLGRVENLQDAAKKSNSITSITSINPGAGLQLQALLPSQRTTLRACQAASVLLPVMLADLPKPGGPTGPAAQAQPAKKDLI